VQNETPTASGRIVRAAVVQAAPVVFDIAATIDKVATLTAEAAAEGAELVVFPEAFVSGYPRGSDFGAVIGNRTDEGRDEFLRYWNSAIEVPGPRTDELGAIAAGAGAHLVIGVIERDRGTLYCAVVYFDDTGTLLGKRRKLMPTGSERLVWGFGDGSTLDVFDTDVGRLGAVICWENYMPLLRTAMYQKGIEVYCAPTADHRDSWTSTMVHIATEGRCFVLGCNQVTRRSDFPHDYRNSFGDDPDTLLSRGGSCIVDPLGTILAGPVFDEEVILTAELPLDDIIRAKYDFDVIGHYARPDVFSLAVDERPKRPVVFVDEPAASSLDES
jgi:nitrilase